MIFICKTCKHLINNKWCDGQEGTALVLAVMIEECKFYEQK